MRWPVVRLIAGKEFRDLLRDRRTVLLIIGMPMILYPVFGLAGVVFAQALLAKPAVLVVSGAEHLPAAGSGVPPLLTDGQLAAGLDTPDFEGGTLAVEPVAGDPDERLKTKQADVALVIPPGFAADLAAGKRPTVKLLGRDGDEKSKVALRRLAAVVEKWQGQLRAERFKARGLPADFDQVLKVENPQTDKPREKKAADELRDSFARVFPFILMMWLVAGAIQPAVDMTAGEKERGTMETLLISPAERTEIVAGKFAATTGFAFASVVWNVLWITGGVLAMERFVFHNPIVSLPGLVTCVVLGLPLAMFFSAVCLALGVFAKSTKEGQYYLMPLILLTMPLAFWGMMPGAELTPANCWVPVTGAMLLQSRLLSVTADPLEWWAYPAVLGSLAVWVAAALGLAVWQFRREGVLFREVGPAGGGLGKWFKRAG
jgi:sodium transport system permease protein